MIASLTKSGTALERIRAQTSLLVQQRQLSSRKISLILSGEILAANFFYDLQRFPGPTSSACQPFGIARYVALDLVRVP